MAASIITSVVTGGTNSAQTVAEELNTYATDFVTQGVVGAITLNTGSGGTGSFCVNADASPDMGVTVKAGQAYVSGTPSGQDAQVLRARMTSDYTTYTINANTSGSTKYDWIYLQLSAANANNPSTAKDNVITLYTSRSTSNASDNGSPPTYGLLLAVVTVANGAASITNSNITDKRFNTSIGAQNGSLIVTQQTAGTDAIIQAAGSDANINLKLTPKGTGVVKGQGGPVWQYLGYAQITAGVSTSSSTPVQATGLTATVTIPSGVTKVKVTAWSRATYNTATSASAQSIISIWDGTVGSGTQISEAYTQDTATGSQGSNTIAMAIVAPSAGSKTYNVGFKTSGTGTTYIQADPTFPAFILVECC